jgi:diaminopimelate decarboxylase
VEYLKLDKAKRFAVVDASMSELLRPALYESWHPIVPVREAAGREAARYDVVGPVCESSDVLGLDRELSVAPGDLLAILAAGAYGMAMSSNSNSRPRPCEVLVDRGEALEVRARETAESRFALERRQPERARPRAACKAGDARGFGIESIPIKRESDQIVRLDMHGFHGLASRIGSPISFDANPNAW